MHSVPPILVFCDLDDTLFESRSFSVDAATRRAFERIEEEHIPIVLCSSKTRAQIEHIQQELGISQPFTCENGAAAFVPWRYFGFTLATSTRLVAGYEVLEFGKRNEEVVYALHRLATRVGISIVGFSDMSVEDVAAQCDLSLLQARLAKLREYTEEFCVVDPQGSALPRLCKALNAAGFECMSRGRHVHVGAIRRDDGSLVLRRLFERAFGPIVTVAFGDHDKALPLLCRADLPLVVQSTSPAVVSRLLTCVPGARISTAGSLARWSEMILEIADTAQRKRTSCSS